MNTHEYQAKEILRRYGIDVPPFRVVRDLAQFEKAVEELAIHEAVLKIQVHAGGRGKAGGVKIAKNREEMRVYCKELLGMKMVNAQTGPAGVVAHQVMVCPVTHYRKEYYLGAVIDRDNARGVLMASPEGGMEIEEVAEHSPEKILTLEIPLSGKMRQYHLVEMATFMGWHKEIGRQGMALAAALARAFVETDASLIEINPLVETYDGRLLALDAKLSLDENALFRQQELACAFDATQLPRNEVEAKRHDLAFVALEGEIGCMVNGAGLAMATMDIIHNSGGKPANFLDVGGGASQEKVAAGFKILLSDPNVSAILVNIFGGIMNCVTLAAGIISAASELAVEVPLVVRMEGTNVEQGRKMLMSSGLKITIAESLTDAAQKVVAAAAENRKKRTGNGHTRR